MCCTCGLHKRAVFFARKKLMNHIDQAFPGNLMNTFGHKETRQRLLTDWGGWRGVLYSRPHLLVARRKILTGLGLVQPGRKLP